ncbi:MAG: hypothetical protein ACKVOK_13975 [Flavobacteriales bacterium]
MKFLFLIFLPVSLFAQPDPAMYYRDRLEIIEQELAHDPDNHALLWERLEKRTSLMMSEYGCEVFYTSNDTIDCGFFLCYEMERDFIFFEFQYARKGDFSLFEEGDFYLLRMNYFEILGEYYHALHDAYYLRDVASYSQFQDRGEYYYDQAMWSLFRLQVKEGDYFMAKWAIDQILDKSKETKPEVYFAHSNHWYYKVKLMEHFGHTDEIVPYVRDLCITNFDQYFSETWDNSVMFPYGDAPKEEISHTRYREAIKNLSFTYLESLVQYASIYEPEKQLCYEAIFFQLRDPLRNSINQEIGDDSLFVILRGI